VIEERMAYRRVARFESGVRTTTIDKAHVAALTRSQAAELATRAPALFARRPPEQFLSGRPLSPAALLQAALAPAVSIASLLLATVAFGQDFSGPYVILALIVFSATFPGRAPHGDSVQSVFSSIVASWMVLVALLLLLGWTTGTLDSFDWRVLLAWTLGTPLLLLAAEALIPFALPRLMAADGVQRVAVIAGACQVGRRLAQGIELSPFAGIRVCGYFDDRSTERLDDGVTPQLLGSLDDVADYVKRNHVDLVYIALPMAAQPRILALLDALRDTTVSIYFVPDIFLSDLIQARMDTVGGLPVVAVRETPLYGTDGWMKRASDLALASSILLLITPLMLLIALAVKVTSPGPVLFRQRRYGLDGREIVVYKFRTMSVLEDGDEIRQATQSDARVTKLGAFLRRSSLDELPQFINVLQGRMSVVGPRPHAVAHNELYRRQIKGYMIRHKVKPGITGWAQVNGLRGETDTLEKMQKRVEYDLAYLRHWSLRWDLEIVARTVLVVWKKENAY